MKKFKRRMLSLLTGIAALRLLAACSLEPPPVFPAPTGKTGRVVVGIANPGEAAASRTLFPLWDGLKYKLEFTRQGAAEPALVLISPTAAVEVDIDSGDYTLGVSAYETNPELPAAGGSAPVRVEAGEVVSVTIHLTQNQADTGALYYTLTLPQGMTLSRGSLTLYPLSGEAAPTDIDLISAGLSGVAPIFSGHYRIRLSVYGSIGGAGKSAAKTGVLHIIDHLTTTASYTLAAGDFMDTTLYVVGNSTELNGALTSIRGAPETLVTILVSAGFSSPPAGLEDPGYDGKTIVLRGSGGIREISLSSQGSLFTLGSASGSASSGPVLILQDITLKGISGNNAALLKLNRGELVMESGAAVTGNTAAASSSYGGEVEAAGGGVYVAGGGFTMRDNASVSGNTAYSYAEFPVPAVVGTPYPSAHSRGGGVYVAGGIFTMEDSASVSGNRAYSTPSASADTSSASASACGGGVFVGGGTFIMEGGSAISGNLAITFADAPDYLGSTADNSSYGGGVYIAEGGTLTKGGGVIYGSGGGSLTNSVQALRSTIARTVVTVAEGAAVYYNLSPARYRDTTVGTDQNLSTGSEANWSD